MPEKGRKKIIMYTRPEKAADSLTKCTKTQMWVVRGQKCPYCGDKHGA